MGHTSAPNLLGWVGDHRPKDPIGGLVGQAAGQRPSPKGGALEGADQAKSRPYHITHAREKAQHLRYQLAFRRSQAQANPTLNVEKHSRVLAKCEARTYQSGPNKLGGDSQTAALRQSINFQRKRHPAGTQRPERRERFRETRLHENQRLVEP